MGDDIETSGTPQSDVSREGEGPSRAQVGDGDGAAMSDPIATLPTSDEGPDECQSNGEASEPEEEEEENRSSGGSVVNFDTTSEQEPDEPDLHTMKGINKAKRTRPARTETVRKKMRHDLGQVGERVRHLERLIRDLKRATRSKRDGHPSYIDGEPHEDVEEELSDVAMEAPPTVASMSRDTTRSRGSADRMALHRDSGQELAGKAIVKKSHQTVPSTIAIDMVMVATRLLRHLFGIADVRGDGMTRQNSLKTGDTTRSKPQGRDPDRQSHLSRTYPRT